LFGPFSFRWWIGGKRGRFGANRAALVYEGWSKDSIYHWLCDSLPRLLTLEAVFGNELDVLLPASPESIGSYQERSLAWLGWKGRGCRIANEHPVRVRELYVADCVCAPGQQRSSLMRVLRSRITESAVPQRRGERTAVYVSRAKATARKLINEADVKRLTEAHGFETVYLEEHTPEEQVAIMAGASIVLGTHGGGLANILYCDEGTPVVEIRNESMTDFNCYYTLAAALGLPFHYVMAAPEQPERLNYSDLRVDIPRLEKELQAALSTLRLNANPPTG
jgi:prepilin-type processing-associated H-X9-DG protein